MEFLKKTATYLYEKYGDDFSSIHIILPNRRAGLFLRNYLSQCISRPIFLPEITSIQDFVIDLSGATIADEFTALVQLYKSYVAVKPKESETFDDFLHWGGKLLQDFDELDQHLADTEFVFSYLNEDKNLALWALDQKPLSDFQKNYLEFYKLLHIVYKEFISRMTEAGIATYGMACRKVAALLKEPDQPISNKSKVVFAGLNALTASEELIIETLYDNGLAEMLWDGDEYFLNEPSQEAGSFIRKYLAKWRKDGPKWVGNDLLSQKKNITVVAVAGKVGQVKYTAREIKSLLEKDVKCEEISVVLNEENLLIPMLNSIPEKVEKFNITMGYPMKHSAVYNFMETVFEMHENSERLRSVKNAREPLFYYKDLRKLFSHQFLASLGGHFLTRQLDMQERIFYTLYEIKKLIAQSEPSVQETLENLFKPWHQDSTKAVECLSTFLNAISDKVFSRHGLEAEFLYTAMKHLTRIKTSCETAGFTVSVKTLHLLFTQYVSQTTVPFAGEPLSGLQIMGMLETRALDFDTVFLLSVNEGVLPRGKSGTSFIPHGIRVDCGLPTYKQNEEIFAYHFYRILQRSNNIYLIYNTQPDDMGGGECSRFVNQVVYELPKKNPEIKIKELFVTFPPEKNISEPVIIKKDEKILQRLDELAEKGLSPSGLNMFRKCPLQYYFSHVAGIWESEVLSETIDSREFGDQIHEVLEDLFRPYEGKILTCEQVSGFMKNYGDILQHKFENGKPESYDKMSGKNLLIYNVIHDYIRYFLEKQNEILETIQESNQHLKLLFIEKIMERNFTVDIHGHEKKLKIKGKADRIDCIGNTLQIIDYKSGDVSKKIFSVEQLCEGNPDFKTDYAFQVLMYLWLFGSETDLEKFDGLQCGVWSFRDIEAGINNVYFQEDREKRNSKNFTLATDHLDQFELIFKDLLKDLFDPAKDFVQTQNEDNCELCPYVLICGK